ncbi:hypothetical protein GF342_02210 [Candidatus Woesearchaeota archaeon]|nr:hypothetical protein [Candidatus Woesearchaeota archaeon]
MFSNHKQVERLLELLDGIISRSVDRQEKEFYEQQREYLFIDVEDTIGVLFVHLFSPDLVNFSLMMGRQAHRLRLLRCCVVMC